MGGDECTTFSPLQEPGGNIKMKQPRNNAKRNIKNVIMTFMLAFVLIVQMAVPAFAESADVGATPKVTAEVTPEVTPKVTPKVIPEVTPKVTPTVNKEEEKSGIAATGFGIGTFTLSVGTITLSTNLNTTKQQADMLRFDFNITTSATNTVEIGDKIVLVLPGNVRMDTVQTGTMGLSTYFNMDITPSTGNGGVVTLTAVKKIDDVGSMDILITANPVNTNADEEIDAYYEAVAGASDSFTITPDYPTVQSRLPGGGGGPWSSGVTAALYHGELHPDYIRNDFGHNGPYHAYFGLNQDHHYHRLGYWRREGDNYDDIKIVVTTSHPISRDSLYASFDIGGVVTYVELDENDPRITWAAEDKGFTYEIGSSNDTNYGLVFVMSGLSKDDITTVNSTTYDSAHVAGVSSSAKGEFIGTTLAGWVPTLEVIATQSCYEDEALDLLRAGVVIRATDIEDGDLTSAVYVKNFGGFDPAGPNAPGEYTITYEVKDSDNNPNAGTITSKVTVKAVQTEVVAKDVTIYVGDAWAVADNFVSAKDKDGSALTLADMTVTGDGAVDVNAAGTYPVTFTYDGVSDTGNVIVKAIQTEVVAKDVTIYVGGAWAVADNFVSAKDKDGNALTLADMTVTGNGAVDVNAAGTYPVTFAYDGVSDTGSVIVKAIQTEVVAKDVTIYVGDAWAVADNFVSAKDKDGNALTLADMTVTGDGAVDVNAAGTYPVTFTYDGVSDTGNVIVKPILTEVNVHDSSIYVGDAWSAEDNFGDAKDKDGNALTFADMSVGGDVVDVNTPGDYDVTYTYDGVTATAKVTVKPILTEVNANDSSIYVGDAWTAEDNFGDAKDKDGNALTFADMSVGGDTVDINTPGDYDVTYTYDGVTATAKVTVKPILTTVEGKDSTITVGDKWDAKDNFVSATDKDGNPVDFDDVTVTGSVDTDKAGEYKITYTYDGVDTTITVTVKEKPEDPTEPSDSTKPTESTKTSGTSPSGTTGAGANSNTIKTGSTMGAKTGDSTQVMLLMAIFIISGFVIATVAIKRRRGHKAK